ncbi:MAG: hypothetical protein ACRDRN_00770 [Sciscionella sp.]
MGYPSQSPERPASDHGVPPLPGPPEHRPRSRMRIAIGGGLIVVAAVLVTGPAWQGWLPGQRRDPTTDIATASAPKHEAGTRSPAPPTRSRSDPQTVADTYVRAINRGDLDLELTTLCVRPSRADISKARAALRAQRPVAKLVGPVQISGDTAYGSYIQHWEQHGQRLGYPAALTLRRIDGTWCIAP